jgi:hypothetical protein
MKKNPPNKGSVRKPSTAEQRFETVMETFHGKRGIAQSRMFGSTGLTIHGKVFAILYKERLVLKLPKDRVEALVRARQGEYFDPGHGRISKGWVSIQPEAKADWLSLSQEAKDFVASV